MHGISQLQQCRFSFVKSAVVSEAGSFFDCTKNTKKESIIDCAYLVFNNTDIPNLDKLSFTTKK